MAYASIEDVWKRKGTDISDTDYVTALLEDAAIIIYKDREGGRVI